MWGFVVTEPRPQRTYTCRGCGRRLKADQVIFAASTTTADKAYCAKCIGDAP